MQQFTIAQLIEELRKFPAETPVKIMGEFCPTNNIRLEKLEASLLLTPADGS